MRTDTFLRASIAGLLGAFVALTAPNASAYCFATTCDPKHEQCAREAGCTGDSCCVTEGEPLHWGTRCVSFGVQKDGSPLRHIPYERADLIIRQAFDQWLGADCPGGGHPSLRIWDLGGADGITCAEPEFNDTKPNANVWMFRDKDWPYADKENTLAFTSTIYDRATGALLDADVEINSRWQTLTTTDTAALVDKDLGSIVTHEAGHFLGLGHSKEPAATMNADYSAHDLDFRSLHEDDVKGICALYPPDRDVPECDQPSPPHGFSKECANEPADDTPPAGCACGIPRHDRSGAGLIGLALAGMSALARRRREP